MKATTRKQKESFQPVALVVTLESQAELDGLGTFFNTFLVAKALGVAFDEPDDETQVANQLISTLEAAGAVTHERVGEITDAIKEG